MRSLPRSRKSVFEAYQLDPNEFFSSVDHALNTELSHPEAKKISASIRKNFPTWVKRAEHASCHIYVARKAETRARRTIRVFLPHLHVPELHVVLNKVRDGSVKRIKKVLVIKKTGYSTVAEVGALKKLEDGSSLDSEERTLFQQVFDNEMALMDELSRRFSFISRYKCLGIPNKDGVVRNKCITELAEEDLYNLITSHRWAKVHFQKKLKIIASLAGMVLALHEDGICHLDVKPENVLMFRDGSIRLTDFGQAEKIGARITCKGTPGCMAPEMFKRYNVPAQPPMDMWSLGVLFWSMFKKDDNPFGSIQNEILKKQKQGFKYTSKSLIDKIIELRIELSGPQSDSHLKKVYKLISKLLLIDPNQRLTDEEFLKRVKNIQASLEKK